MAANRQLYVYLYIIKYTARNVKNLMRFVVKLYQVHVKIILDVTWYLHTCCKLFKQRASSLLTDRLVIIKPEQMIWTHPDIGLMTARQYAWNRLAASWAFLAKVKLTRSILHSYCRFKLYSIAVYLYHKGTQGFWRKPKNCFTNHNISEDGCPLCVSLSYFCQNIHLYFLCRYLK